MNRVCPVGSTRCDLLAVCQGHCRPMTPPPVRVERIEPLDFPPEVVARIFPPPADPCPRGGSCTKGHDHCLFKGCARLTR